MSRPDHSFGSFVLVTRVSLFGRFNKINNLQGDNKWLTHLPVRPVGSGHYYSISVCCLLCLSVLPLSCLSAVTEQIKRTINDQSMFCMFNTCRSVSSLLLSIGAATACSNLAVVRDYFLVLNLFTFLLLDRSDEMTERGALDRSIYQICCGAIDPRV